MVRKTDKSLNKIKDIIIKRGVKMLKEYINLEYKPTEEDVICEYHIEPIKGVSFEKAATNMAGESSIDTWSEILTLNPELAILSS